MKISQEKVIKIEMTESEVDKLCEALDMIDPEHIPEFAYKVIDKLTKELKRAVK